MYGKGRQLSTFEIEQENVKGVSDYLTVLKDLYILMPRRKHSFFVAIRTHLTMSQCQGFQSAGVGDYSWAYVTLVKTRVTCFQS